MFLRDETDIYSFMLKKSDCRFRLYATRISAALLVLTAPF